MKRKIMVFISIIIAIISVIIGANIIQQRTQLINTITIASTPVVEVEKIEPTVMYTTLNVNLRGSPSLEGKTLKSVSQNVKLTKVANVDDWSIVQYEDAIYFIETKYLSNEKITPPVQKQPEESKPVNNLIYLGKYKLTYYCSCVKCCGKSDGITASGKKVQEGLTVACNSLPLGTKISIEGHIYEVQDRGGMKPNVIDIYVNSHQKALNLGVKRNVDVYKVKN